MIVPGAALSVLCTAVVLVATTSIIRQTSEAVVRDTYSLEVVEDLEATLLRHARVSNLEWTVGTPELAEERRHIEAEATGLVEMLRELTGSETETGRVDRVDRQLQHYLAARHAAEREERPLAAVLAASNPALNDTLETVREIEAMNETELERSTARAAHWDMVANAAGAAVILLVLMGVSYSAVVFRRHIARPLTGIYGAVERFRRGEQDALAPETGAAEIRAIASAFNDGMRELAERRRMQLAFLAGVAHDLRTPLAAVKAGVQVLREDHTVAGQPDAADSLARLDRQIDRLTRMVADLSDATQIESGELELEIRDYDLRYAAREMVALYAPTSPRHEVTVEVPDEPVRVRADPLRMEEVVSNLLSNAIKYSPRGGPVEVALHASGLEAVLTVTDRGVGITAEQHADIFLPFRRGSNAAGFAPGSGLGLSVVRRIVAAHGGRVEVESTPDQGSTFRVRMPLADRVTAAA